MQTDLPRAVIMAGGRSERMRASNGPRHKALVEIDGVPLIAYNLVHLARAGFRELMVVACPDEPELCEYVVGRGASVCERYSASLHLVLERERRGSVGILGQFARTGDLLVVPCDTLSALDPGAIVRRHRMARAALTLTAHRQVTRHSHGELALDPDGIVAAYEEKPTRSVVVSSGFCVVGTAAAALIPRTGSIGVADLFTLARRAGLRVASYVHGERWVDVDDAAALIEAEALVRWHTAFAEARSLALV